MLFIVLFTIIALAAASVSEGFSIVGLGATYPAIFWSAVAMGAVFGAGKLALASFLYRFWSYAPKWVIGLALAVTLGLTALTMIGHYGYLTKGYQQDSLVIKQVESKIATLQAEEERKIERKKEIDKQIAQLPSEYAGARVRLMKQFKDEQTEVTNRINDLDKQITDLKSQQLEQQAHVGPITFIAEALGLSTDRSIVYLTLLCVALFDPMVLSLTFAINIMWRKREEDRLAAEAEQEVEEEEQPRPRKKKHHKDEPAPLNLFELAEEVNSPTGPTSGTVYNRGHKPEDVSSSSGKVTPIDAKVRDPFAHKQ